MVISFLYFISIIRYPTAEKEIIGRAIWTLVFCVPIFCLVLQMKNLDMFFCKHVKIAVYALVVEGFLVFYLTLFGGIETELRYNMSFGYMLLFPILFLFTESKKSKFNLLLAILLTIGIMILASRGPLLFIALYILICYLFHYNLSKKIILSIFIFLGGVIFYFFGESLLQEVSFFFETMGFYSRTLDKILMGADALENLSDREIIWETTKNNIWEKPYWGWGIAGDLSYMDSYPHNITLEILLHYGIFVGSIVLFVIFFSITKSLFVTKFRNPVLLIFLCSGFGHLFLSSTYLIEYKFWILLGICFSIMKKKIIFILERK
ncbi:MAG: O-antigen ligase family protein [Parabacteroides sp.]